MRIFKMSYRDQSGAIRRPPKWSLDFADHSGRRRRFVAFSDKRQSEDLARKIEHLVEYRSTGETLDAKLVSSLKAQPERIRRKLVSYGLLDVVSIGKIKPLCELVAEFSEQLRARGRAPAHVDLLLARITKGFEHCNVTQPTELDTFHVERRLLGLKEQEGFSNQTYNHYLRSLKQFARWLLAVGVIPTNPLQHLSPLNVEVDRRCRRRAFTDEELRWFIQATGNGPTRRGRVKNGQLPWRLTGRERALLYTLAAETGLRSSELRALTVGSFDLGAKTAMVRVPAASSKRRREDPLPVRKSTSALMAGHLSGRKLEDRAFAMPRKEDVARLLFRPDLGEARRLWVDSAESGAERRRREESSFLRETDEMGQRLDFHALRHTFVTRIARAEIGFRTAQRLARHSTPTLLTRYAHSFTADEVAAVEGLPPL